MTNREKTNKKRLLGKYQQEKQIGKTRRQILVGRDKTVNTSGKRQVGKYQYDRLVGKGQEQIQVGTCHTETKSSKTHEGKHVRAKFGKSMSM